MFKFKGILESEKLEVFQGTRLTVIPKGLFINSLQNDFLVPLFKINFSSTSISKRRSKKDKRLGDFML